MLLLVSLLIFLITPMTTMSPHVDTPIKERKEKKWGKMKITIGSVMTAKV